LNDLTQNLFSQFVLALAPMEDITDSAFRHLCKCYGADLMFTEFVSADALIREAEKSKRKLRFDVSERPLGIQIFGNNTESVVAAARIAEEVKPDFIDLNFGCPVRKIVDKGGGAALLKDIPKMITMVSEVVKNVSIPVSAKTRLGWDEKNIVICELAEQLQDAGVAMLTIHGRTKSQMYKGVADWEYIGKVKNNPRMQIPVIGNGDIDCPEKAKYAKDNYGVDGVMIGRAAIGNPWIYKEIKEYLRTGNHLPPPLISERIDVLMRHLKSSVNNKGERTAILEMRKHYSGIFRALPDFKPFRMKLVVADTFSEVEEILSDISQFYNTRE